VSSNGGNGGSGGNGGNGGKGGTSLRGGNAIGGAVWTAVPPFAGSTDTFGTGGSANQVLAGAGVSNAPAGGTGGNGGPGGGGGPSTGGVAGTPGSGGSVGAAGAAGTASAAGTATDPNSN
jgi:hypothetical protein